MVVSDGRERISQVVQCTENEFVESVLRVCSEFGVSRGLMASVVHDDEAMSELKKQGILVENIRLANVKVPFEIAYETPETLGADRIAAVAGAYAEFGARNMLVIDAGTMMTFEFLAANGTYLGGNISLGMQARFRAMNAQTERLPLADEACFVHEIGTSTLSALAAGVVCGMEFEVQGAVKLAEEKLGGLDTIVLTGGSADFLASRILDKRLAVRKNLVLDGVEYLGTTN